jgi:hypothetical protein
MQLTAVKPIVSRADDPPVQHGAGPQPRAGAERTPGEEFAAAVLAAAGAGDVEVAMHVHLPAAFPLFSARPRYTVRHLMKTAAPAGGPVPHVYEPPAGLPGTSGTSYAATPERSFQPRLASAELTDLTVEVPLPSGILDHPDLLASYVDFRVLVRLSVVENESLLHGTADGAITGLLRLPGLRRRLTEPGQDLAEAAIAAASAVEETGGSCDGIVAHPSVYWGMVRSGLLERLAVAGVTVSRTRMMPADALLLGDFRAAATLLLPGIGTLALRRGAGPGGADLVRATTRVGLSIHLPQHLMLLISGGHHG